MLPIMIFSLIYRFFAYLRSLKSFTRIIEEIWLDRSGIEIKVRFRNGIFRKIRNRREEQSLFNSVMQNPSDNLLPLKGKFRRLISA